MQQKNNLVTDWWTEPNQSVIATKKPILLISTKIFERGRSLHTNKAVKSNIASLIVCLPLKHLGDTNTKVQKVRQSDNLIARKFFRIWVLAECF